MGKDYIVKFSDLPNLQNRMDLLTFSIHRKENEFIYQSLNLSLSLRDRDRVDTIITLYHTTPPETF